LWGEVVDDCARALVDVVDGGIDSQSAAVDMLELIFARFITGTNPNQNRSDQFQLAAVLS
jgi:hypothetical protein